MNLWGRRAAWGQTLLPSPDRRAEPFAAFPEFWHLANSAAVRPARLLLQPHAAKATWVSALQLSQHLPALLWCSAGAPCRQVPAPSLISPSLPAPPSPLPLSQRQLMFMQRPLLHVNCVRGKQVG